jgi:hypothetical protein
MKTTDIPSGAIIHIWGHSLFGRLIRWYEGWKTGQKGLPSHTAIYFGSGKHEIVEAGRKVMVNKLDAYFNNKYKVSISYYKTLQVQQLEVLKAYCYGTVGRAYDWPGILSFIFKKVKDDPWKNFCDELIGEAFQRIDIPVSNCEDPSQAMPGDVYLYCKNHIAWETFDIWTGKDWDK